MILRFIRRRTVFHSAKTILLSSKVLTSVHLSTMKLEGIVDDWCCQLTPEEVLKRTDDIIESTRKIYDSVAAVSEKEVNQDNVLKVLDKAEWHFRTNQFKLLQMQHFVEDAKLRNASRDAEKKLLAFGVEICMNQDIFKKLTALKNKNEQFLPDQKRFLDKLILTGRRYGLHLSDDIQKEIKELKTKINDLCIQFTTNIGEDSTTLEFNEDDLIGLPKDFIDNLDKLDSGKLKVTLKYPDYFPIMQYCRNPETRKAMHVAFNSRCIKENKEIFHEVVKLRHKVAGILGYPNHAAYVTEILMSKSPDCVNNFLSEIGIKMQPLWKEERKYMLEMKEKECADLDIPFDGKLHAYDYTFYTTKVEEIKYALDQKKLKEYFPLMTVTKGLCEIYQMLLGVTFSEVKDPDVWHKDVQLFKVNDTESGVLMGYFFLDLFPRDGKYNHACVVDLQPSCRTPDGKRQVAVAAMLTNFAKPHKDRPSLLDSGEVTTFFHEFGHLMHYLCAQPDLAYFDCFAVEKDFVEAPSQMLENWCYEVEPLRKMSGHYLDHSEIPQDLLEALIKSRLANTGYKTLRQIGLATFDFTIHSSDTVGDFDKVYEDTIKELMGIETIKGTSMPCSFSHLFGGYDSQYYGYMWSEVFSIDMFYTCFKDGKVMDPVAGKDYRQKILAPASSKDAMDLLEDFLGRKPTEDAFLKSKGLLK